ncbi:MULTISPECIES: hypothetical protein [unclassified Curtobacterium]|uniref:hypothetical protein n=1 Tax=unclassified Curtobacterium TaxID=257496 RepID=UPI000A67CD2F|nr:MULTISPECIES: hypothetical protein [unclassified Curtobacterium]WIA96944.1 hypothetical protein QOL16_00730 [Curtobacterium sp. MCBA15_004]WIB00247.1 hypothetical protein QOL15_00745 [Curtobacterium sp. MCBA15_012]
MKLLRTALTGTAIATAGSVALGAAAARRLLHPAPFTPPESELVWTTADEVPGTEPDGIAETHVVHVHGQSIGPQQVLRGLRVWRELGASNQVVDTSGLPLRSLDPTAVDRIAAAAHAARARGARRVVLQGWSAGALAASAAAARTPVDGIVGVAPLLDVRSALRGAVTASRFPAAVGTVAVRVATTSGLSRLAGVPYPLSVTRWQDEGTPTLLLHSAADPLVDPDDVATRRAHGAEVVTFATARHTLEWNEDPERWEQAVRTFAAALPA